MQEFYSIAKVQFIVDELPLAVTNLVHRVKELGGKEQQSNIPTREPGQQPFLNSGKSKQVQSSQQEDMDLER